MFSKLTTSLALSMSLMLASNAMAQTKKADSKKAAEVKAQEAKKAEEARLAAAKKAEEEKAALEAKRAEEAKVAAQKAEAQNDGPIWGYIKSKFSASYHGEYYFQRRMYLFVDVPNANESEKDLQDLKIMHNPTIIYRPIQNWKVLATSEFKYTDAVGTAGTFINRHYRSLVLVTRENILTEKENGLKMDISIGRRIFDRNHGKASSYGNSRVNTNISKKFSDELSTSLLVQYLANDPAKKKISSPTWKHSLEIIPSFTYQITDKLSYFFNDDFIVNTSWHKNNAKDFEISHEMNIGVVSYQFNDKNSAYLQVKYLHFANDSFNHAKDSNTNADLQDYADSFEYYIGHTYSFTPKLSVTSEIGNEIFKSGDHRDGFSEKAKYPEFALYLDWAL